MSTNSFGAVLVEIRRRKNLRQKQVAAGAGLDPSYIAGLERGRRLPPRREQLARIIDALGATAHERDWLLATAAADRLSHAIAQHRQHIDGAEVLARIARWLPDMHPEDLITIERVAMRFTRTDKKKPPSDLSP
jgi:transcriptional regulator with XRE-family HTH domain